MNSLEQLHSEMRSCRKCSEAGYEITPGAIFSGISASQVMVIGQAPGVTEVAARRPFNAGSGRRLFEWLAMAGWEEADFRGRHYMTAVTKCFPGKSRSGRGDRVPSKVERALCRPYLEKELSLVDPRLIIPVGRQAIGLFYPAGAKLEDVIGTCAYFSPELAGGPASFDLGRARKLRAYTSDVPVNSRWLVALPHPSGASLWPNKPENRALIERAVAILSSIRVALGL